MRKLGHNKNADEIIFIVSLSSPNDGSVAVKGGKKSIKNLVGDRRREHI
jgi:hypothetical protein